MQPPRQAPYFISGEVQRLDERGEPHVRNTTDFVVRSHQVRELLAGCDAIKVLETVSGNAEVSQLLAVGQTVGTLNLISGQIKVLQGGAASQGVPGLANSVLARREPPQRGQLYQALEVGQGVSVYGELFEPAQPSEPPDGREAILFHGELMETLAPFETLDLGDGVYVQIDLLQSGAQADGLHRVQPLKAQEYLSDVGQRTPCAVDSEQVCGQGRARQRPRARGRPGPQLCWWRGVRPPRRGAPGRRAGRGISSPDFGGPF